METWIAIITTIATAAVPLYFKWKKAKNESDSEVTFARDNPAIDQFRERMRNKFQSSKGGIYEENQNSPKP